MEQMITSLNSRRLLLGLMEVVVGFALLTQAAAAQSVPVFDRRDPFPLIGFFDINPGADLSGVSMPYANLAGVDLTGANLTNADLSNADLSGASLGGANLTDAVLDHAALTNAHFSSATLVNTNFSSATMIAADLSSTILTSAGFSGADLSDADLSNADISGTTFGGTKLSGVDLTTVQGFDSAVFIEADLQTAVLAGLTITIWDGNSPSCVLAAGSGNFVGGNFAGADLSGADLSGSCQLFSRPNFTNSDLTGANLSGVQWSNGEGISDFDLANLTKANMTNSEVTLSRNILSGANFTNSRIKGFSFPGLMVGIRTAIFTGASFEAFTSYNADPADLSGLDLSEMALANVSFVGGVDLTDVNFRDADLQATSWGTSVTTRMNVSSANLLDASFVSTDLTEVIGLKDAILIGATFDNASLPVVDFSGKTMTSVSFISINLATTNFTNTDLQGARFISTDLTSVIGLKDAILTGATFDNSDLTNVDFTSTNITGATFTNSDLTGANLSNQNLVTASLSGSTLVNTNLAGSDLRGSDLTNTDIRGAAFDGADLVSADLTNALWLSAGSPAPTFVGATYSQNSVDDAGNPIADTVFPAFFDPVTAGMTLVAVAPADDQDGDGVADSVDNCPAVENPTQANLDGDTFGDACDEDRDGDSVLNAADAFPDDATETADSDSDGVGDNTDLFPLDSTEAIDTDGDGTGDNGDAFPSDPTETLDTDGDLIGNNADWDDDGDIISDEFEVLLGTDPLNPDTDGDGLSDSDEILGGTDPLDPNDPNLPAVPAMNPLGLLTARNGSDGSRRISSSTNTQTHVARTQELRNREMNQMITSLNSRRLLLALVGLVVGFASAAHSVTFNDGGTHIIDATNSYPLDPVVVEDSPTGQPTTLIINEGGDIGSISGDGLTVNGSSVVTMNGGNVAGLSAINGMASVTIAGGELGQIRLYGSSQITIDGGVASRVSLCDQSTYRQSGGVVTIYAEDASYTIPTFQCQVDFVPSRFVITGGSLARLNLYAGDLEMTGGSIGRLRPGTSDCKSMSISGMSHVDNFEGWQSEYGGCDELDLSGSATVHFIDPAIYCAVWLRGIDVRVSESAHISGIANSCGPGEEFREVSIEMLGGSTTSTFWNLGRGSLFRVVEGIVESSFAINGGRLEILGGTFGAGYESISSASGSALLMAGPFQTPEGGAPFEILGTSHLEIVGTNFNYPLGLFSDGAGALGTLTGTLADGSALSIDFQKAGTASILLRAPSAPTNSDLAVSFVSPPTTVDTYGTVFLPFSVTNNGPDPADNVEVTFDAPATAVNPTITTGTWSQSGSTFTSDLGTLASGASITFEMTYSVGGDAGTLDHQVGVLSNIFDPISIDPDELNNSASTAITIQCGTSTVYGQNPVTSAWVGFPGSCDVPAGWNVSLTAPAGFVGVGYSDGYSDGAASVDTQFYYDNGYTDGSASVDTQAFYDSGFSSGVASVDTQSFFDSGFSSGVSSVNTQPYYDDGFVSGAASREPEITTLEEDLAICLPEPGTTQLLISGILGLVGLSRVRSRSFA